MPARRLQSSEFTAQATSYPRRIYWEVTLGAAGESRVRKRTLLELAVLLALVAVAVSRYSRVPAPEKTLPPRCSIPRTEPDFAAFRLEDYSGCVTAARTRLDHAAALLLRRDGQAVGALGPGRGLAHTGVPDVLGPLCSPERLHQMYLERARVELDHQHPKAALEYARKAEELVSWTEDGESRHLEGLAYYAMGELQGAEVCLGEACISNVSPRAKLHYNLVIHRHPSENASPYNNLPSLPPCPTTCPICHPHR